MPINGPFGFSQSFHDGIGNGIADVNNITYHLENYPLQFQRRIIDLLRRAGVAPTHPPAPNNRRNRAMDEYNPPPYPDEELFPEEEPPPAPAPAPSADDPAPGPPAEPGVWTPTAQDLLSQWPYNKPAIEYLYNHATHQQRATRRKKIMRTLAGALFQLGQLVQGESLQEACQSVATWIAPKYAANPEQALKNACKICVRMWNYLSVVGMGMAMTGGGMGGGDMGGDLGGGGLGAGMLGNYMLTGPGMGGGFGGGMGAATGGGMWPSGGFGAGPI